MERHTGDHFRKFSAPARRALFLALEEAQRLNHSRIDTRHLLLGLLALGRGEGARLLGNRGGDLARVRSEVQQHPAPAPEVPPTELFFAPDALRALAIAVGEARSQHREVATAHLFLGILRIAAPPSSPSPIASLLETFGINPAREIPRVAMAASFSPSSAHAGDSAP